MSRSFISYDPPDNDRKLVYVTDYGARGDGVSDDTSAIVLAVAALTSNSCLVFPPGNYVFNNSDGDSGGIVISNLTNVEVVGHGAQLTLGTNAKFMGVIDCSAIKVHGFKIKGTMSNSQRYVGNSSQGQLIPDTSDDVEIYNNRWEDTAGGVFVQTTCSNIRIHNNSFIRTHAGVQSSSAVFSDLYITDNYFLGHVYQSDDIGSDDQIAIFGNASGSTVISRNIIDKQGPTAYNQARAINVSVGAGNNSQVVVSDNIVKNVVTTTLAGARPAIVISGTATEAVSRVLVIGNVITNCNIPISAETYSSGLTISNNTIKDAIALADYSTSGTGIKVLSDGIATSVDVILSDNSVLDCESVGISVSSLSRALVSSNLVTGCSSHGIVLDTVTIGVITANLSASNTGSGIFLDDTEYVSAVGNACANNGAYGIRLQGTSVSGTVVGNSLYNNTTDDYIDAASASDIRLSANYPLV